MEKKQNRKAKSSDHHTDRLWDPKHPRHGLPIDGCKHIIDNPSSTIAQENGRFMYIGEYLGEEHELVVSAAVSAVSGAVPAIVEIDRVVTAYNTEEEYYLQNWEPPEG